MAVRSAITPETRQALTDWYQRNRQRSAQLFDLLDEASYYSKPIDLRHPIVFYEGHLPAFSFNTLVKRGLGGAGIDANLEKLFARGIDPHESEANLLNDARAGWPSRADVQAFAAEADSRVIDALQHHDIEQPGHPMLDGAEAAYAILEHEAMHQETLLYMWHRLPLDAKRAPAGYAPQTDGAVPHQFDITVAAGRATLGVGADDVVFSWDNERPRAAVDVEEFAIDAHNVTNAAFLEFVQAGGYRDPQFWRPEDFAWIIERGIEHPLFWERQGGHSTDAGSFMWRGMFEMLPLPMSWPVYVSQAEASAFARWRGRRLPTEAEFQRAAYGSPSGEDEERKFPWGDAVPDVTRGVFDFASWDPAPAGSHAAGTSGWAIHDLAGNGWEWTGTVFAPFDGFTPLPSYPEYSADFFDEEHFVMKGASPATARELIRPSFRNWFRPRYPYVYAGFRTVANR